MPKSGPGNSATTTGSSIADAYSGSGNSVRHTSARHQDDERFAGSDRLRRYGGILSGFAETYAGALDVTREAVLDAVADVETFIYIDGNEGTSNPGGSQNRIQSDEHPERTGTDQIYIAVTLEQFEALAEAVGAEVSVR